MKFLRPGLSAIALSAAAALPAQAELTANELWSIWQDQLTILDQEVTADVTETETGLVIENFTTIQTVGDPQSLGSETRASVERIELVENGDGTINVVMSDRYEIATTFPVAPGEPNGSIRFELLFEEMDTQVSGDSERQIYTWSADRMSFGEFEFDVPSEADMPEMEFGFEALNATGTYELAGSDPATARFTSSSGVEELTFSTVILQSQDNPLLFKMEFAVSGIQGASEGRLISLAPMEPFQTELPEGYDLRGEYSHDSFALSFTGDDTFSGEFSGQLMNEGGSGSFEISEQAGMLIDTESRAVSMRFAGADLPAPLEANASAMSFGVAIPLAASDDAQDFALRTNLAELVLADGIWNLFDPGEAISRDPIGLILDMTGQVVLPMGVLAIGQSPGDDFPGEVRSVRVNELQVAAGGAELNGSADVTFAPDQVVPMPVGSAELQLSGGNALMDSLVEAGLLPAQQRAMAMGMIGAFARPGAGPDTLETTIEFGEGGSISANGIPLQ